MSAAATALAVYSAQILIVIGVAALAAVAVGLPLPAARLTYWRAVLGAVPAAAGRPRFRRCRPRGDGHLRDGAPGTGGASGAATPSWAPVAARSGARGWSRQARAFVSCGWPWAARACGSSAAAASRRGSTPSLEALRRSRGPRRRRAPQRRHRAAGDVRLAAAGRAAAAARSTGSRPRRSRPCSVTSSSTCSGAIGPASSARSCCARRSGSIRPIWWALEQVHVSREQVVDRLVVERTSSRRALHGRPRALCRRRRGGAPGHRLPAAPASGVAPPPAFEGASHDSTATRLRRGGPGVRDERDRGCRCCRPCRSHCPRWVSPRRRHHAGGQARGVAAGRRAARSGAGIRPADLRAPRGRRDRRRRHGRQRRGCRRPLLDQRRLQCRGLRTVWARRRRSTSAGRSRSCWTAR